MSSAPMTAADIYAVGQRFPESVPTAAMVEILSVVLPHGQTERLRTLTSWLFDADYDPAGDAFVDRYLAPGDIALPIAAGVTALLSWDRQTMGLLAAELAQDAGDLERAVGFVEQLEPTTVAAVSLAELYAEQERWSEVVDLTNGVSNDDEASTFLLIQRGTALRELQHLEAARAAFKEALRVRSRPSELRHLAWIARGHTYLIEGKKSLARKDYERVLAEDAAYPGLPEMLSAVRA